jgi:hypothetical protein
MTSDIRGNWKRGQSSILQGRGLLVTGQVMARNKYDPAASDGVQISMVSATKKDG